MRFLFIDRVTGLERGRRITGIKSFAATEPFLESHFTRAALVPGVLLIEAMAQLLGWLASYTYDFRCVSVLALISDVTVPAALKPGARARPPKDSRRRSSARAAARARIRRTCRSRPLSTRCSASSLRNIAGSTSW